MVKIYLKKLLTNKKSGDIILNIKAKTETVQAENISESLRLVKADSVCRKLITPELWPENYSRRHRMTALKSKAC